MIRGTTPTIILNDPPKMVHRSTDGKVYKCYGIENRVFPDSDLGDELQGAAVSHNHTKEYTEYSFSKDDFELFQNYHLEILRGEDVQYQYDAV